MNPNKRRDDETLDKYHTRLKMAQYKLGVYLRGYIWWASKYKGTYRKEK